MDSVLRPDIGNVVMIGLIAFAGVWLIDRALRMAGRPQWTTNGA